MIVQASINKELLYLPEFTGSIAKRRIGSNELILFFFIERAYEEVFLYKNWLYIIKCNINLLLIKIIK